MPRKSKDGAHGAPDKGITKRDAVRQALQRLGPDAMPKLIREFVHTEHGLALSLNLISNYKNNLLKKAPGQSGLIRTGRVGRPPAATAPANGRSGNISVGDLEALKRITDRIGPDQVRSLVGLLGR